MVESDISPESNRRIFVIKPNRSLSWKQSKRVFFFLAACLIAVGFYFFQLGAWVVLPFAGLEIALIGTVIYRQFQWASRRQVIEIGDSTVWISESDTKKENRIGFPAAWLQIKHNKDPHNWYSSRLFVGSHGQFVEIGKNLVESEREFLAEKLRVAVKK